MGGAELDIAASLVLAGALGCPPHVAGLLLTAIATGFHRGLAKRRTET